MPSETTTLLEVQDITFFYGKIQALHGISLEVGEGEVVSLIGANGAGKTSTMRALSGMHPTHTGSIRFNGEEISKLRADERVKLGISLAPEGRGIFPGMTVAENLDMGAYTRRDKAGIAQDHDRVFGLFPRLAERRKQVAGSMSGGEQQMVAIGRALMARPKLLMLDEPSMGLAPMLIQQIFQIIGEISSQGTTILLVEQNAQKALSISDRAYVLETGSIIKTGAGKDLLADPTIREAYLGVA